MLRKQIVSSGAAALAVALFGAFSPPAAAHDIPNDITIQMFLKPSGNKMDLLVRVPLEAMRDVSFPERGEGYLDMANVDSVLPDAATVWLGNFIKMYEGSQRLPTPRVMATHISLPSDKSFGTYDSARKHILGPKLPDSTEIYWNQAIFDVILEYPIRSDQSLFSIDPDQLWRLGLRTITVLRVVLPNGEIRPFEFITAPGLVRLEPQWYQAAARFVQMGFEHILSGTDHLLFLFCLVIPFRKIRALLPIITSFTIAHSITLAASAYNLAPSELWFPPLIEALIAVSIVYMALENIVGKATVHRRWMITFGFGLVHGFGFSYALRETLQFAGDHMLTSLLSFNTGVELGQIFVLMLMVPALELLFKYVVAERMGTIILSAIVAHTAWHWMVDRWAVFRQYRIQVPGMNDAVLALLLQGLMVIVAVVGIVWLVKVLRQRPVKTAGVPAEIQVADNVETEVQMKD